MSSVADLVMVGVSHQSLPLADLERIVVRGLTLPDIAQHLGPAHPEVVVLSTCSRTEIYATSTTASTAQLLDLLAGPGSDIPADAVERHTGDDALRHLFRVTAGLESRIAGEVDIFRQVRAAARDAESLGTAGPTLRPVFAGAIGTARRIHRETALGAMGRSLGRSAIDDALAGQTDPSTLAVALVGTGKMAAAALDRLRERGVRPMVFERRRDGAAVLGVAECDRRPLDELLGSLADFHVVVCATSSPLPLLDAAGVLEARRVDGSRLHTIVDLGVPRNAHPDIAGVDGVHLIDIESVSDRECGGLAPALATAATMVEDAVARAVGGQRRRDVGQAIAALQDEATASWRRAFAIEGIAVSDDQLDRLARAKARRLVHECIEAVHTAPDPHDAAMWAAIRDHVMPPSFAPIR